MGIFSSKRPMRVSAGLQEMLPIDTNGFQREAKVSQSIKPYQSGRIDFLATSWPAKSKQNVSVTCGTPVYVVGRVGLTLIVEPI